MSEQAATADEAGTASATPTEVAQELLLATKVGDDPDPYLERLAAFDEAELERVRTDRQTALAFWSNCYNAGTQLLLSRRPGLYESPLRFFRFFGATAVTVAGTDLSLDDIENSILRASRSKYTLGYTRQLWPGAFARRYRLSEPDPRLHFALNCGAESCPAIRFYEPEAVDEQLDEATKLYLERTVEYDAESGVARIPRVCLWFRGDFGGGGGIREFLRECGAIPDDAAPTLRYHSWDWGQRAGKFAE